ncbi:MAG TPA: enoyl-CoA hydratase [Balneola sp.]|jgi:enoyl-CoA hydratase|nr:enoyl-CoA hydratase [Bacteroidota bacterium]HCI70882.1 enoyl-CoA hydratase [Balneola sp.]HCT51989.1 enoyl-CoA hydratase [Balneola sp.]|tara:strand:+ start:1684 stop:2463 length:780 start_codon:yes stop_codon:yes gene_type:complete
MSLSFETILLDVDESGVCVLTVNRPEKMNALNNRVFEELDAALDHIKESDDIKGLIVTGAGDKAFVAGADIKELNTLQDSEAKKISLRGQRVFQKLEDLTIPAIAAVNGYALGGGCELAMACHIRIASKKALLGLPEVSLGLIPGYGGTQRLPKLVGEAKALELTLSGRFVKADEAKEIGLVNQIAEESVLDAAKIMMNSMMKQGPLALKNAILAIKESGNDSGYTSEANLFGELYNTDDFKEGTSAFLEKRKPTFTGK